MSTSDKRVAATYQYDPLDRLTDAQGARRYYNNTRLATLIEGERSTCFFEHDTQPLALQRSGTAADTTLLATDAQTSVLTSLPAAASPSTHHYTPYGHQAAASSRPGVPGFNGEHPDPLTGHYLLGQGYRAFNPVLMRFNSPDSLSPFEEGGINAYAYGQGDPVNRVDPSGHYASRFLNFLSRGVIKAQSRITGAQVKSVKNVTRLSEGIVAFEDTYKNKSRLNFIGHGTEFEGGYRLKYDDKNAINAASLYNLASNHGLAVKQYENLRTVMCYSGDGGANSFGAELSLITGRPVKAYQGTVMTSDPDQIIPPLKVGETYSSRTVFAIEKNRAPTKYLPRAFKQNFRPVTYGSNIRATN